MHLIVLCIVFRGVMYGCMYIILICKSDNYIVGMIYAVSPGIFYTLRYPRYDLIEVNPTTGKVTRSTRISDWGKWRQTFYKFIYIARSGINIFSQLPKTCVCFFTPFNINLCLSLLSEQKQFPLKLKKINRV